MRNNADSANSRNATCKISDSRMLDSQMLKTEKTETVAGLVADIKGATMVEYALLICLICLVCIASINVVGMKASGMFGEIAETLPS